MPDDDWAISNGTVEFRQEERLWALGRFECDRDDIDESAGLADECGSKFEFGDLKCGRESGHPGPHRVGDPSHPHPIWFNDAGRRIEGGSAEDYA